MAKVGPEAHRDNNPRILDNTQNQLQLRSTNKGSSYSLAIRDSGSRIDVVYRRYITRDLICTFLDFTVDVFPLYRRVINRGRTRNYLPSVYQAVVAVFSYLCSSSTCNIPLRQSTSHVRALHQEREAPCHNGCISSDAFDA